jgi:hypothetical protein
VVDRDTVSGSSRVMTRDSHGEWELCAPAGTAAGQTRWPIFVSVDSAGNLYVLDRPGNAIGARRGGRLQRRDRQGRWTVLAEIGPEPDGQLGLARLDAVAAAPNGSIYVSGDADLHGGPARLRMRDSKDRWTPVAEWGHELGQVGYGDSIVTDSGGRLYVSGNKRVQVRDVNGKWYELGHLESSVGYVGGLTVDRHGTVYIAPNNNPPRVLRWTPQPKNKVNIRPSKDAK